MNDQELLELAAKAAGIKLVTWGKPLKFAVKESKPLQIWNPIEDDGDALRLAVKLGIDVLQLEKSKSAYADNSQVFYSDAADPYAATRRAIVRAAAEIGKSK